MSRNLFLGAVLGGIVCAGGAGAQEDYNSVGMEACRVAVAKHAHVATGDVAVAESRLDGTHSIAKLSIGGASPGWSCETDGRGRVDGVVNTAHAREPGVARPPRG